MTFNERLKELRLKKGVSQLDVANYLGVTKQAYSYYELGKRDPSNEMLYAISDYFGVSLDYLFGLNNTQATDDDIKFALFGGEKEITDEMYEEVKSFAQYVKEKYGNKKE